MTPGQDSGRHGAAQGNGAKRFSRAAGAYARALLLVFAFVFASAMSVVCHVASAAEASVQQPPAYGHAIADVLEQKVLLEEHGRRVDLVAPPSAGRISLWLERRPSSIATDSAGRRWLVLRYQIINAPEQLSSVTIPALKLPLASGATLDIPDWSVTVAPLTLSEPPNVGRLTPLQGDRIVAAPPLAPIRRAIAIWASATFVIMIAWGLWWFWREQRERAALPFARTWRALRGRDAASMEGDAQTWRLLHDALNATAGRVVRARSLPDLLHRAPHLQTLEPQIETFFRHSSARFFQGGQGAQFAQQPETEHFSLREFARALYRAERRNRR
jgi:mxaA protein